MNLIKIISLSFLLLLSYGCSETQQLTDKETKPFKNAISIYFKGKAMDMKVAKFKTLELSGDKASAKVQVQDIEGLYNIKPTWKFSFEEKSGKWIVTSYSTKIN